MESAHQHYMLLLARSGQRSNALAHYAVCRRVLAAELDVAPSPETTTLYEQIKAGKFARPDETTSLLSPDNGQPDMHIRHREHSVTTVVPKRSPLLPLPRTVTTATPQIDWSPIPHLHNFHGRQQKITQVKQWLGTDRCRLVAILGMGGQGKTTLAAHLVRTLAEGSLRQSASLTPAEHKGYAARHDGYAVILWHTLLNAPPLSEILQSWLLTLSNQIVATLPATFDQQFALLLGYLQQRRCLLVLDNLESILDNSPHTTDSPTRLDGLYRPGYEMYGELLRRVGENNHQSCLLFTSRERPRALTQLEEATPLVRSLHLNGLSVAEGQAMLQARGLTGPQATVTRLIQRYAGNPLALNLIAETIWEIFDGDLVAFVQEDTMLFANIRQVLDLTFARLAPVEREIALWLAIEREPTTLAILRANVVQAEVRRQVVESLHALTQRFWVEKQETGFSLQNVVLEYLTDYLRQTFGQELILVPWLASQPRAEPFVITSTQQPTTIAPKRDRKGLIAQSHLNRFALVKAQAKEYVRESQVRLLLQPLAEQLMEDLGKAEIEKRCKALLAALRTEAPRLPGYIGANLLHLLIQLDVDLRYYDFSQLAIWQANLRGVRLPAVNFTQAAFKASSFTESFTGIVSLVFSPDSHYLVAGTVTGTIFLWRLADQSLYQVLPGHTDIVFIAVSPNGQHLASAGADGMLCIWDLTGPAGTNQAQRILCRQSIPVSAVAFSPNGDSLVSANDDGSVYLWHWQTQALPVLLYKQQASVAAVTFSPDGKRLASAGEDGMIYLWDITEKRICAHGKGHTNFIWSLAFSPDSQLLASASSDQTVRLWQWPVDGDTNEPLWTSTILHGHTAQVYTVSFSPDGNTLASGGFDHTIRLWDLPTGRCEAVLVKHKSWVRAVVFSPDGTQLASGGNDQTICLWDMHAVAYAPDGLAQTMGRLHSKLIGHTSLADSVAFSPDGQRVASSHADQLVRLWNVQTGVVEYTLHGHVGEIHALAFSPDGTLLTSVGEDGLVRLWDSATGQLRHSLRGDDGALYDVAFSPDGESLAVGGNQPKVCLWDVRTGQLRRTLLAPFNMVWSIAFSPDGRSLATGTHIQGILCWDVASGALQQTLDTDQAMVLSLAFHPTEKLIAGGGVDRVIRLWEVNSGRLLQTLNEPTDWVFSVAFHPQGTLLAAGTIGGTIYLWSVEQDSQGTIDVQLQRCLYGHSIEVNKVVFSPDGKLLASAASDETIRLWDVETGICLKILRAEGPYAGMNIAQTQGLTFAQKSALITLGAIEN